MEVVALKEKKNLQPSSRQVGNFRGYDVESKEIITNKSQSERIEELETLLAVRDVEYEELYKEKIVLRQKLEEFDHSFAQSLLDQTAENNDIVPNERLMKSIIVKTESSKEKKLKNNLEKLRSEREAEFDQGAPERLMARVKTLDEQLEASHAMNYKLKLAILFLSTYVIGYVAYENSALVKEGLTSPDFAKLQLLMKSNFVKLMNLLKVTYEESLVAIKHADGNYLLMACRNLGITIIGGIAVFLAIKLIAKIESIMNAMNRLMVKVCEWRGAICLLLIAALIAYNRSFIKD